jgi:O-antigen/teichoic acid export membrane protein
MSELQSVPDSSAELAQQTKRGILWTLGGTLIRQAVMFFLSLALARLLDPSDYGLIGTVLILTNILISLQDTGLAQAVVFQRSSARLPDFIALAFYIGLFFMLVLMAAAGPVARFYVLPALEPVMRWVSVSLVLDSLRCVLAAEFSTSFRFRQTALVEGLAALISGFTTLALAWQGYGVWSLVTNSLLGPGLQVVTYLWLLKPSFTLWPAWGWMVSTLRWGIPLTGASLLWKFYDNADFFVVGKLMGPKPLGQYTLAFRLATMVNDYLGVALNRVSLPAFSAVKDHPTQVLVQHWLQFTRASAMLSVPALVGLACMAEDFIRLILGVKWLPAVLPLRLLVTVGLLRIVTPLVNNMLVNAGHRKVVFHYSLLCALTLPVSFYAGCRWDGLPGVGMAWVAVLPLLSFWLVSRALKLLDLSWRLLWIALSDATFGGVILLGVLLPILWLLPSGPWRFALLAAGWIAGMTCSLFCVSGYAEFRRQLPLPNFK